jgi:hypothetical protein
LRDAGAPANLSLCHAPGAKGKNQCGGGLHGVVDYALQNPIRGSILGPWWCFPLCSRMRDELPS